MADALRRLHENGYIRVETIGGHTIYRRTTVRRCRPLITTKFRSSAHCPNGLSPAGGNLRPGAPSQLDELVGQQAARAIVRRNLDWAKRTRPMPANMLLYGPSWQR